MCLKPDSFWIQIGAPEVGVTKFTFEPTAMIFQGWKIIGSALGTNEEYEIMLKFIADNDIKCMNEHFEFDEFEKAFDKLENGQPIFRCVVDTWKFSEKFKSN